MVSIESTKLDLLNQRLSAPVSGSLSCLLWLSVAIRILTRRSKWAQTRDTDSINRNYADERFSRRSKDLHADAGTHQIAITVDIINASHGGPELEVMQRFCRETGLLPRVWMIPFFGR